jgi:hypothetical protein
MTAISITFFYIIYLIVCGHDVSHVRTYLRTILQPPYTNHTRLANRRCTGMVRLGIKN